MIDIINFNLVIRNTVGYEFLNQVELKDLPSLYEFLNIVYKYNMLNNIISAR